MRCYRWWSFVFWESGVELSRKRAKSNSIFSIGASEGIIKQGEAPMTSNTSIPLFDPVLPEFRGRSRTSVQSCAVYQRVLLGTIHDVRDQS